MTNIGETKIYKASLGLSIKIITSLVFILFAWFIYKPFNELLNSDIDINVMIINAGVILFFFFITIFCYVFAPQKYGLNDHDLIIYRLASNKKINLQSIKTIKHLEKEEIGLLIRTFGVGGFFGNFGWFYSNKVGRLKLYATQRKNYVLLTTNTDGKIMITPDDLQLVEDVKGRLKM